MIRLLSSKKSNGSCPVSSPSDSCHDDKSISCFPWHMPRPGIPAALRTLQLKRRASTSVTSQSTSLGKRRSLFSLFGKHHSTPVVPISGAKDHGVTCVQELRVSKSVGAVTDQFAKLNVGVVEGGTRSTSSSSRRSMRHQGSDQGVIKCAFSLPGAVIDGGDEPCDPGDATLRTSFYSEIDTSKASSGPLASNEAKPSHVHDEMTFTGQAGPAHEVDILVISHIDDELKHDVHEEQSQELTMVEKMPSISSEDNDINSEIGTTGGTPICEPEYSLDNESKDNPGKPDMDNGVSPSSHYRDITTSEDLETHENHRISGDSIPYDDEDNLEEEVKFFERTSEEGDDYVNLDDLLDRCPKSEVIRNLQSAVQLSKCATRQLERALKKWSRISRGPFPREPGTSKTKADIIDSKTVGLRSETARYLDLMNKVFFNFYCVTEKLDDVEERQERLVDSIKAEMCSPTSPSSSKPIRLPKRKQDLADLYLGNRFEGRFENHKVKALLGNRIPPMIIEEAEE